jgi:CBS domain-containing protein
MQVRDIMTPRVVAAPLGTSITDVARTMSEEGVGSLVVTDADGKLAGIVTDRRITHTVVAAGVDPRLAFVDDYMFTDFVPLEPDMDILQAIRLQREVQMRRLPVVEDGVPVGIVSVSDVAAFAKEFIDLVLLEGEVRVLRRNSK